MNLNTIVRLARPKSFEEIEWRDGHAWLAGGTWLFSEPQIATDTLVDLEQFGWPALAVAPTGLEIGATCKIAELNAFEGPTGWRAAPLFRQCVDAFLMSFKIWNAATVGGNLCLSLPAGAMISLTAALEGICTLWPLNGPPREVSVVDFVTGNHTNVLHRGELLRKIYLPISALSKRCAMRHASLTHHGRSAALIIGTLGDNGYDFTLTITAATPRPVQVKFNRTPSAIELRQTIDERLPPDAWFLDVHGSAAYKRHVTFYLAEQIRSELA